MSAITLDFPGLQQAYHQNAKARRDARTQLVKQLRAKAEAENEYRKARAVAFAQHRAGGKAVEESKIHADHDAAQHALNRDLADAEAKGWQARLAELEAERASLRQLAELLREET